jgi:GntR family transcriptional regulator, transcriptional repressor for pyruvate dehydrogenase complex
MNRLRLDHLRIDRPRRLYEQIAERIRALIADGTFAPGSALPSERELAELVGVSRPSIREALIALETMQLIETRQGGGNFVRDDAHALKLKPVGANGDLGPGTLEQFEARRAIECACAELAATRAQPEEIEALAASVERMRKLVARGHSPLAEHSVFHTALAAASHNQILASAVAELWRVRDGAMWSTLRRKVDRRESWVLGIEFRETLIAALRRRESPACRGAGRRLPHAGGAARPRGCKPPLCRQAGRADQAHHGARPDQSLGLVLHHRRAFVFLAADLRSAICAGLSGGA